MNGIEQLCPNCGLCCDSTLFADVELRAGDDAGKLKKAGVDIFWKTKSKCAFSQPCACFDGKLCKIYHDRPKRCRQFECGLLKKVEAGEMTVAAASRKISAAKSRAGDVRALLRVLGQRDEALALAHRYSETMGAPVDFSKPDDADKRGELMLAVSDLMVLLQNDFI